MLTNDKLSSLGSREHNFEYFARTLVLLAFILVYPAGAHSSSQKSVTYNATDRSEILFSESEIDRSVYPSISAILKKYHELDPENVALNWIHISPIGMRVRDVSSRSEVIKNFSQQRVWLVNGMNKTRYEVDIKYFQQNFPEQLPNLLGVESISNIAGLKPCADLTASRSGERFFRGQVVEEWRCSTDDGELYSTQLFSSRWNLVVQVKHRDMSIEELTDIKKESYAPDYFQPIKSMVNVEFEEFMTGKRNLDTYSP